MAHVRKRTRINSKGRPYTRWTAVFSDPHDPDRIRTKTFAREGDALRFLDDLKADVREGRYVDPEAGAVTLAAYARGWLERETGTLAASTRHRYRSLVERHIVPGLGSREIASLEVPDLRTFVAGLSESGLAPKTVRHAYTLLMEILRSAADDKLIASAPTPPRSARRRFLPRVPRREQRILAPEELRALADAMPDQYRVVPLILGYSGLRWSELVSLRVENLRLLERRIDINGGLVEVNGRLQPSPGKTAGSAASIRIPAALAESIAEHLAMFPPDRSGFVVRAPRGGPLRYSSFYSRVWIPALKEVGLGEWVEVLTPLGRPSGDKRFVPAISPHGLRHTAVSLAIAAGANVKQIQELARHATATMTLDRYAHLLPTAHDEVAERLDAVFRRAATGPRPDQGRGRRPPLFLEIRGFFKPDGRKKLAPGGDSKPSYRRQLGKWAACRRSVVLGQRGRRAHDGRPVERR